MDRDKEKINLGQNSFHLRENCFAGIRTAAMRINLLTFHKKILANKISFESKKNNVDSK